MNDSRNLNRKFDYIDYLSAKFHIVSYIILYYTICYTSGMKITQESAKAALDNVLDPELNLSITDLGLIYEITVQEPVEDTAAPGVHILMTLTTLGCPLFNVIESDIKKQLVMIGVPEDKIEIELTFDPPWSMDRMSENAKAMLGI